MEELVQKAKKLYESGYSIRRIAKELGVSLYKTYFLLGRAGVKLTAAPKRGYVAKLQQHTSGGKYTTYTIYIPRRLVEVLGWKKGDLISLGTDVSSKVLLLRRVEEE